MTAASYRNSSFLVIPQAPVQQKVNNPLPGISRNPSRSVSPQAAENRSFCYFQARTLPQWTEFFDSELWTRKMLQLSHVEPAIKHGILALSALHERYDSGTTASVPGAHDFALSQYMQAVKHSNELLAAHLQGRTDVEAVLIACIIFVCYENLAGNYRAANMHLQNGLRILSQHRRNTPGYPLASLTQASLENILSRFDLQAMSFSDGTSPYEYNLGSPPQCPMIPPLYTAVTEARDHLVELLRCMMWIAGVGKLFSQATFDPQWLHTYYSFMASFEAWESTFELYQQQVQVSQKEPCKTHAGIVLLRMYATMARTIIAAGSSTSTHSELAWDAYTSYFQTIVDLAETLPQSTSASTTPPSRSRSSSTASAPHLSVSPLHSPFSPAHSPFTVPTSSPAMSSPPNTPTPSATSTSTTHARTSTPSDKRPPPASSVFTPSFELSPIIPLFVTACRCRDPFHRRRAIALLLNRRRREGVWDSYSAGIVAAQVVRFEEGISSKLGAEGWLPMSGWCRSADNVPVEKRVRDVAVNVGMEEERKVGLKFEICGGGEVELDLDV